MNKYVDYKLNNYINNLDKIKEEIKKLNSEQISDLCLFMIDLDTNTLIKDCEDNVLKNEVSE